MSDWQGKGEVQVQQRRSLQRTHPHPPIPSSACEHASTQRPASRAHLKVRVLEPARKAEYTTDTRVSSTPAARLVAPAALMRAPSALQA